MVESLRMDFTKTAPDVYRHLLQMEQAIGAKVDKKLLHLIKMRASQINGCAYCMGCTPTKRFATGKAPSGC